MHDASIGSHNGIRLDVVAGQTELSRKPPHSAAKGQPADACVRDVSSRRCKAVLLRGLIQVSKQRATTDPGLASDRVDANRAHGGQVDHDSAVRHGKAEHAVAAALHSDLEAGFTAETHA